MSLADILASWLIFRTFMLCFNLERCSAACLLTVAFSTSSCCQSYASLSSFSLNKVETSVALSIVVVSYAPMNCDNLVKFLARLKGMSLQTMSMGSFSGGSLGVSILFLFLCLLTIALWRWM